MSGAGAQKWATWERMRARSDGEPTAFTSLSFSHSGWIQISPVSSWPSPRRPPPPTVSLVLLAPIQQAGQGRHCHGWEARGKDGENHSRAFLLSLGDERTQRTLTISHRKIPSSVSLRARHSVTLNRVRMKMQDF